MSGYTALKEAACLANIELPKLGLVIFTFGNVSVADHDMGAFAIKPSGVPYDQLSPDKMVVLDFDGNLIEGELRPSSDTNTHAVLYKNWEGVGSIVHTHSTYATAWAQAQREIPIYGTTHADHFSAAIPCIPALPDKLIKKDYERATGLQIVEFLSSNNLSCQQLEMILLACHAPFTWGKTPEKALYNSAILEYMAKTAFLTERIYENAVTLKESLIKKHYERKHGPSAYYGQNNKEQ